MKYGGRESHFPKGGATLSGGERIKGPNSDDWIESLALCIFFWGGGRACENDRAGRRQVNDIFSHSPHFSYRAV
jgi:hypothetical protein